MLNRDAIVRNGLNFLFYGLCGVAIFLPWRAHYTNVFVVASGVLWLLYIRQNRMYFSRNAIWFILLLISIYIVEVIGMSYTENVSYGLHRLESKLSIVVFPVIILASGINRSHVDRILAVFTASTFIACLYCVYVAFREISIAGKPYSSFFRDPEYSNISLTTPINILHPTFLTLFICLAVFSIVTYLRHQRKHYWLLLVIAFLIAFSFQLASRAGYLAMLCTMILIGFSFIGLRRKVALAAYCLVIIIAFVLSITMFPTLKQRLVQTVLEADITKEQVNSVSYHFKSWTCAVESWLDGHILFGYGTGDEVITLSECYQERKWAEYGHDAHNEFLSSLVKHGLAGFIILSAMFFYPFYLSVKYRDLRYFSFLVIILICFLSESMLRGQTGLVFFTFFNALFLKDMLTQHGILPAAAPGNTLE